MLEWIRNKVPSTSNEGRSQTDTSHKAVVGHKQLSSGSIRLPKIQRRWSSTLKIKKSVNGRASVNSTAEILYRTPSVVSVKEASLISEEDSSFSSDAKEEHISGNVINCHPDKDVGVRARNSRRATLHRRSVKSKAPPPPLHDSMASKSVGGNSAKVQTSSPIRPKSRGTEGSEKTTQAVATITDDSSQTEPSEPALDIIEAINHLSISQHSSRFRQEVQESKANQDLRGGLSSVSADLFIARCASADGSNIVEDRSRDSSDSENEETYTKRVDIASGQMLVKEDDPEQMVQPLKRIQKTTSEDIHLIHTTSEQSVISSRSYSAKDVTNSAQNDHQLIRPEGDVLRPAQQGSIDFDTHSNLPPVYAISLEDEDVKVISMPKTREQRFFKRKHQDAAILDHPHREYPHKHHSKEHRRTIDINEVYAPQYQNNEDVIVEGVLESVDPPLVDNDAPGSSQLRRNEDRTATQLPTSSYSSAQEDARTPQTSSKIDEVKKQSNQLNSSEEHHDEFAQRSFKKIRSILNDLHEVQEEMKTFSGTEASDRDYVYMDEVMMRNLIKLDNIETKGNKVIKDERKKAIQTIQGMMLELERKLHENQDKQKDNVTAAPGNLKNTEGNKEDSSMNTGSEETLSEVVTQK